MADVIAEIGINHNGDVDLAKRMIDEAKKSGADYVKFQTLFGEIPELKDYELSEDDFREIAKHTKGIIFFSTPFSHKGVDFLESLNVPFYKIASRSMYEHEFIDYVASKGKPVFLSTGIADSLEDIRKSAGIVEKHNTDVVVMYSVSGYPVPIEQTNLNVMKILSNFYPVGLSDNGCHKLAPLVAISMGCNWIEKHFTVDNNGPDAHVSANPEQLREMVENIKVVEKMMGDGVPKLQESARWLNDLVKGD